MLVEWFVWMRRWQWVVSLRRRERNGLDGEGAGLCCRGRGAGSLLPSDSVEYWGRRVDLWAWGWLTSVGALMAEMGFFDVSLVAE